MFKNQKGITLVALVITIIVLLILAGVSISMLTGNNGVLTKASDSADKTTIAGIAENVQMAIATVQAEVLDPSNNTNAITTDLLVAELGNMGISATKGSATTINYESGSVTYTVTLADNTCKAIKTKADGSYEIAAQ